MGAIRKDRVLVAALTLLLSTTAAVLAQDNAGAGGAGKVASTEADLNSRIPLPDPLNVPPPSAKDVEAPPAGVEAPSTSDSKPAVESQPANSVETPPAQPAPKTAEPATATPAPAPAPAVTEAPKPETP